MSALDGEESKGSSSDIPETDATGPKDSKEVGTNAPTMLEHKVGISNGVIPHDGASGTDSGEKGISFIKSGNSRHDKVTIDQYSPTPSALDLSEIADYHAPASEFVSSANPDGIGISESDKNLQLRFSIPQAPRLATSSIQGGSVYSNPGTFSISSRGCTTTTAASTSSACSSASSDKQTKSPLNWKSSSQQNSGEQNCSYLIAQNQTSQSQYNHHNVGVNMNTINSQKHFSQVTGTHSDSSGPCPTWNSSTNTPASGGISADDGVDRIDSALLSALNDPREKYGLLRLEQTLVDFMNEKTTGYIEVGGPNNSIVIGGQTGGRLNNVSNNATLSSSIGETDGRTGKQNRFQRLCLHRLADRFNIVRESASASWSHTPNTSSHQAQPCAQQEDCRQNNLMENGPTIPGLIRLVKVKNSRIPPNLLIDLDPARYTNGTLSSSVGTPCASTEKITITKDPSNSLSNMSIENNNNSNSTKIGGVAFVKRQASKPSKKMMIMKRDGGSSGSLHNDKRNKGKHSNKGRNFSEKEKAYAEARARIFNDTKDTTTTAAASTSENNKDCFSTSTQNVNKQKEGENCVSPGAPFAPKHHQLHSASPLSSSAPSDAGEDDDAFISDYGNRGDENYNEMISRASLSRDHNSAVASSTVGAMSKVTWRNRREEENDPDFRRGYGPSVAALNTQLHYGTVSSSFSGVSGISTSNPINPYHMSDSHYGVMHNSSPKNSGHYNPHQQIFYPSGSVPSQQHQRQQTYNNTNSRYFSQAINQQQQQQQATVPETYYKQTTQTATSYFAQPSVRSFHRNTVTSSVNSKNNSESFESAPPQGLFNDNSSARTSTSGEGRQSNIVYNMDEFPALG